MAESPQQSDPRAPDSRRCKAWVEGTNVEVEIVSPAPICLRPMTECNIGFGGVWGDVWSKGATISSLRQDGASKTREQLHAPGKSVFAEHATAICSGLA